MNSDPSLQFVFGFEETKFTHTETLEARQGSIVSATFPSDHIPSDSKSEKRMPMAPETADVEAGSDEDLSRKLTHIRINPAIPRKTYLQKLALTQTSPGKWSDFLRHSWQPFMILATIPGVLFCSLVYAILLAWSTVMTTALSEYMLDPPYNFDASQIGLMSLAPFVSPRCDSRLFPGRRLTQAFGDNR